MHMPELLFWLLNCWTVNAEYLLCRPRLLTWKEFNLYIWGWSWLCIDDDDDDNDDDDDDDDETCDCKGMPIWHAGNPS